MPRPSQGYVGPRAQITNLPNVQFSTAAGDALQSFGRRLQTIGADAKMREDEKAALAGKKTGAEAGATSTVYDPLTGDYIPAMPTADQSTAYGKAYAQAAEKTYMQRIGAASRQRARILASQYPDDPNTMAEHYRKWADGVKRKMPVRLQPYFDQDNEVLMTPHILSAYDKIAAAQGRDLKASRDALIGEGLTDAQAYGRMMGQGGAGGEKAAETAVRTYFGSIAQIQGGVDGVHYTPAEAQRDSIQFTSDFSERLLEGVFLGSENKAKMFREYLDGDLQIPVPFAAEVKDKDGNVTEVRPEMRMMPITDVLTSDGRKRAQTFMSGVLSAQRQQSEQARDDFERLQDMQHRKLMNVLALSGNSDTGFAAFQSIVESNPPTETLEKARKLLVNGVDDPAYVVDARRRILAGQITDITQLDMERVSVQTRKVLNDTIESRYQANHWSRSETYKQAEENIRLSLGENVKSSIVLVNPGGRGGDREGLQTQATNRFILSLKDRMQEYTDSPDHMVGHNASGNVFEEVETVDQMTGDRKKVQRFDPEAWVVKRMEQYESGIASHKIRIETLQKERRDLLMAGGDTSEKAMRERNQRRMDISTELRDARDDLKRAMLEQIVEGY